MKAYSLSFTIAPSLFPFLPSVHSRFLRHSIPPTPVPLPYSIPPSSFPRSFCPSLHLSVPPSLPFPSLPLPFLTSQFNSLALLPYSYFPPSRLLSSLTSIFPTSLLPSHFGTLILFTSSVPPTSYSSSLAMLPTSQPLSFHINTLVLFHSSFVTYFPPSTD